MRLEIFNTHIEVAPYARGDYPVIEKMYTAMDVMTGEPIPCGYYIIDGTLYLPRGTSVSKLEQILGVGANYAGESDQAEKMSRPHNPYVEPRDQLQNDSIEFLTTDKHHQLALNLRTGAGKTFCVTYSGVELNERMLVITPDDGLKSQWLTTFVKQFDYKDKEILNITGSVVMEQIVSGDIEPRDAQFVNHQTLRSYLSQHGPFMLRQFFRKLKIGIKVYDEAHKEFYNILLMDSFSNTNRTWYLTATFDRSSKSESVCFKRAFNSVEAFGEYESMAVARKHVQYYVVYTNSRAHPRDIRKLMGFGGLTAAKYGRYTILMDPNETAYKTLKQIVKKMHDVEGKMLIFIPLIEAIEVVVKKLRKDFPDKTVGEYHSKVSKDEKISSLKRDIIVTTIASCGTGVDIPRLRIIISLENYASRVTAQQCVGRLRPYADDKDTYFFDAACDQSVPNNQFWTRARLKKIETLVKQVTYLNMDE